MLVDSNNNNCGHRFITKFHSILLVLFFVSIVQIVIFFHVVPIKNHIAEESQLVELLKIANKQHRIININQIPLRRRERDVNDRANQEVEVATARCEPVHVVVVCGGASSATMLVTLVKSLLFYRRQPLQLHLIVDRLSERSLRTLFLTWDIPDLKVHFYSMSWLEPEVGWVNNSHYSGKFGLMKLVLTGILPASLSKVICLDTDLTFNADIMELWQFFKRFGPKQALGLVDNQSNWYLQKRGVWPALGRGFNSGLILMDLDKLRKMDWLSLWKKVAISHLRALFRTQLADQDIINAVIKEFPFIHFELPCQWNVQLNENARSDTCIRSGAEVKVIHWNSLVKEKSWSVKSHRNGAYFHQLFLSFSEYDGSLLRKDVLGCPDKVKGAGRSSSSPEVPLSGFRMPSNASSGLSSFCRDIVIAANREYRTHLFYLPFEGQPKNSSIDITFVTQLSLDRILMLESLAAQWAGQISAAVFASDAEVRMLVDFVRSSPELRSRRNIAYHIVYKQGVDSLGLYPVNYLRNVAMAHVTTDFILLADIDFTPKMKMRDYITGVIEQMGLTRHSKVALVIPPFETSLHRFPLPITKRMLLVLWERNLVLPFRMWKPGQFSVNFSRWKNANELYEVEWTPNFEPYFVISRDAPRYDTRFVGFGWNKVAHSMTLNAERYKFIVLPEAFLVHQPHSPSISNSKFRLDPHYRSCMYQVKNIFLAELKDKYNFKNQPLRTSTAEMK